MVIGSTFRSGWLLILGEKQNATWTNESMEKKRGSSKLKIAIIHPDLGIGGAERLIVDAAVELASHGHNVHIFTAHHDKTRCFEETLAGEYFSFTFLCDDYWGYSERE
ncbi:hypothetical protein HHK36_003604 [Tetracentron sinense]|uniref:Alpha-1,3/1,6-mannosyltransferase ALG2 n=1 Tax=Tetracentron sinense TaxID=13715 RepID=A0A834ZPC6_TETSI|nr:hypothetical protein HHK36_003604 [Tetracentron sinense]